MASSIACKRDEPVVAVVAEAVVSGVVVLAVEVVAVVSVDVEVDDAVVSVGVVVALLVPGTSLESVTKSCCAAARSPERRSLPSCLKSLMNW